MPEARVIEVARAKINLALHVLGRRDDGYHAARSHRRLRRYRRSAESSSSAERSIACDNRAIRGSELSARREQSGSAAPLRMMRAALRNRRIPQRASRSKRICLLRRALAAVRPMRRRALRGLRACSGVIASRRRRLQYLRTALGADVPVCSV